MSAAFFNPIRNFGRLCNRCPSSGGLHQQFLDHSERVLNALGLTGAFEEIFDIRVADYLPKPFPEPYHAVLDRLGIPASHCIMVDDSQENLRTAKDLGMGTILVGQKTPSPWVDVAIHGAVEVPEVLNFWN
jgi:putative hydrolase of the HAD superfamily